MKVLREADFDYRIFSNIFISAFTLLKVTKDPKELFPQCL